MSGQTDTSRLDHLDAARAFAMILGLLFHASLSFMPVFIGWAVQDVSTSPLVLVFVAASHSFRMPLFFLLAGFFSHMTFHRRGAREFIVSRVLRLVVPFAIGWFILHPLVVSGWVMGGASMRGDFDFWAGVRWGFASLEKLPAGIFTRSHLWFLYYLVMITGIVLAFRWLLTRIDAWRVAVVRWTDAVVRWVASSRLALALLVVPTALALWRMRAWGLDTPDQSLLPHVPVLLIYGGCFALGWVLHRQPGLMSGFARPSVFRCVAAALALAATIVLARFQMDPGSPHHHQARMGYVVSYAVLMWTLVGLTIGAFEKLCRRPSRVVRYLADSSYWMYLVHLPIVVWLQVTVAELPWHWSLKLVFVTGVTIAVSVVSYDLFVRSTFLGWMLNGQRRKRVIFAWRSRRSMMASISTE